MQWLNRAMLRLPTENTLDREEKIMAEWMDILLSDILMDKGYIRGPFGSALKRGDMKEDGIPVYEQQHAIYNSRDFRYYIDEQKFNEMKRFQVKKDDLIISCSGTVGKVSIIKDDDPKGIISQALLLLRADTSKVLPLYLKYFFSSREGYNAIVSRSSGSVQVNIAKRSVIEQIPLKLPQIKTQRKIVGVLSSIDEKIEENERINNNLEQQAQAIFKSWFIDFEPFSNRKPNDWSISTLGNVSIMGAGGDKPQNVSPIKTDLYEYPIYSNGLSDEGLYGFTDKPKISEESVTVSARGTIGFVCLRHIPYVPIVRLVTLIPKTEIISAKYLYLWLKQLHITGTGTTQQQLTVPDFQKTEILVPSQEIVTLFTATVEPIFEKIWANQNENEKLSSLRDTLLPKLMSSELDVSKIDI